MTRTQREVSHQLDLVIVLLEAAECPMCRICLRERKRILETVGMNVN